MSREKEILDNLVCRALSSKQVESAQKIEALLDSKVYTNEHISRMITSLRVQNGDFDDD